MWKTVRFLWQSTTSRTFSASPIALCVLGIMVCLARLVGDVSSFTVQTLWDPSEDSGHGPSLPGRPVDVVYHSNSCTYD